MRITLDLHSFDNFGRAAFASLWLDTEMHRWSRESHELLDLPKWGLLQSTSGETHLCGQSETTPVVIVRLERLNLDQPSGPKRTRDRNRSIAPHEQASGRAVIYGADAGEKPSAGRWRILYLDHETTQAEHGNFADYVS
jgi:hypothetical protein